MPNETAFIRYEVTINGEVKVIAGMPEHGVLSAGVTRVKRNPRKVDEILGRDTTKDRNRMLQEKIYLEVGGLNSNTDEHYRWLNQDLKIGDQITIRILGPGESEPPTLQYSATCCLPQSEESTSYE